MKNLELLQLNYNQHSNEIFTHSTLFAHTTEALYFSSDNYLNKYDLSGEGKWIQVFPLPFEDILCLKILTIEEKLCVATSEYIHIHNLNGIDELQIVTFPERIETISWNSTEEVIVTVTANGDVATYNVDYENAVLYPLGNSSIQAKIPDTVYVGWGSKDTQFRGSEGKTKTKQESVILEPLTDRKPVVSWRGNGEMFVINYWENDKRLFVVFETPCKAMYRSEDCPGLQPTIAWRPTGNMIATVAEVAEKQSVVIFEKNGQKRFSIDLNLDRVKVKELKWSPCAQVLAIYSETVPGKIQNVHLFTSSNYRWYEKQTLTFNPYNPLLYYDWLETTQFTFTLKVVTASAVVHYTFRHVISKSQAICGVINGNVLQLTDFSDAIIPPTLFSKKIVTDKAINFICLDENFAAIIDSSNCLKVFDLDKPETVLSAVNLEKIVDGPRRFPLVCHHFVSNRGIIYFAAETTSETKFYSWNVQKQELKQIDYTCHSLRHLSLIFGNCDGNDVTNMQQMKDDATDTLFVNTDSLQNSIKQIAITLGHKSYNFQMTSNCHFYVNDFKICDTVNSFIVFDNYLLYTTKLNELHCVRLIEESVEALLGGKFENYSRSVEQGATIVTAIPNSPKIILQLPRGNLETISCRLISIDMLDGLLNNGKWEEALRFIRLEKLNANLLFDLNPNRFLDQIANFISGVKTINELNNVCLEMEENNVLNTLYKNWGKCEKYPGKIQTIFGEIFKYFDEDDYVSYITTIMIINLHFFNLRDALIYAQDLLRRSYDDLNLKKSLVEAINVLKMYGCDQEKLYTEALLLYDLDLAHFIASCCQMDPRIYEPHLNNLKNLTDVERRYEILLYGKQSKSAIKYLLRCPKVESNEISNFIKSHNVSREAYESCKRGSPHYKIVSKAFAEDLSKRGHHQEAGVILKRAQLLEEALQEYKLGLKWREVLELLEELKTEEVEKLRTINEVAGRLVQHQLIKEAALLLEMYAKNYEVAVKILIENYFFEEATHLAKKYNRSDIIVSEIIPKLAQHKTYLEGKLDEMDETFVRYRNRLLEVRRSRVSRFNNSRYEGDDRDNDLFSDAGSIDSRSTRSSKSRSSTASSRNRRKEEKRKQDLREGGIYEDIALIRASHCLIKEFYTKGEEVRNCCLLLLEESTMELKEIQTLYDKFSKIDHKIRISLIEIWPPHFCANYQTEDIQQLADLENFEHLDAEFKTAPSCDSSWNLKLFSNLN